MPCGGGGVPQWNDSLTEPDSETHQATVGPHTELPGHTIAPQSWISVSSQRWLNIHRKPLVKEKGQNEQNKGNLGKIDTMQAAEENYKNKNENL